MYQPRSTWLTRGKYEEKWSRKRVLTRRRTSWTLVMCSFHSLCSRWERDTRWFLVSESLLNLPQCPELEVLYWKDITENWERHTLVSGESKSLKCSPVQRTWSFKFERCNCKLWETPAGSSFLMPNNFGTGQKRLIFRYFWKLNHGQQTTFIKGPNPDSPPAQKTKNWRYRGIKL